MSTEENSTIERQKREVFSGPNTVKLSRSCVLNDGILQLTEEDMEAFAGVFESWDGQATFFIPASGSGSRMFADLTEFVQSGECTPQIEAFFKWLPTSPIFLELPVVVREKYNKLEYKYLAEYLIHDDGMGYLNRPKGLVPFHRIEGRHVNPFQDQYRQAMEILGELGKVHFTVQEGVERVVRESLRVEIGKEYQNHVSFSYQDPTTDAYCFDGNENPIEQNGKILRRPAGHGALLQNLNQIESDLIFVKNIDNVQHSHKSDINTKVWKYCAGLLLRFEEELRELSDSFSLERLIELNAKYQFLDTHQINGITTKDIQQFLNRPSRVCGMVVNEGAPGGGPFWIEDEGGVSKQIVEKVQISPEDEAIVQSSSHFNPVFMVLSNSNVQGERLNLMEFVDPKKFLVVKKPHHGSEIYYRELPGLWNGSMHHWNTIFVEIPKAVFSPVKTVFDLMQPAHQP
jgi:hypothetical protein